MRGQGSATRAALTWAWSAPRTAPRRMWPPRRGRQARTVTRPSAAGSWCARRSPCISAGAGRLSALSLLAAAGAGCHSKQACQGLSPGCSPAPKLPHMPTARMAGRQAPEDDGAPKAAPTRPEGRGVNGANMGVAAGGARVRMWSTPSARGAYVHPQSPRHVRAVHTDPHHA